MKITISGIGGVGKSTIAKMLAEKLNYKKLSGGYFFRKMAEENNMNIYEFDDFVKKNPEFDIKLDEMQKEYGEKNNNFVLESRIGWFFIPDSYKIKLTCDEEIRLKRIQERDGGKIEVIRKKESERLKSIQERYFKLYGIKNFSDDKNFDLIINTTNLTPEEIINEILINLKKNKNNL